MFSGPFDFSIVERAKKAGLIEINFVDLRNFGIGKHKTVDDRAYGGGRGMVLRVDVLEKAVESTLERGLSEKEQRVIFLGPRGVSFNQAKAFELSKLKHMILICGHYEGIDERAHSFIDEEISVGDFIITGGEIPAMLVTDAVARLIKGVLPEGVVEEESFSKELLEYPQYTRPDIHKNLKVPETLISGHHQKISDWKKEKSEEATKRLRPDLTRKVS